MADAALVTPSPGETHDPVDRWPLDKPFPITLRDVELMAVIGVGKSWFYRRKAKGEFRFLEVRPQLTATNTLYSGRLVDLWVRGELEQPRYFSAARALREAVPAAHRRPGRPRKLGAAEE